jgi:death-on-curing protein
MPDVVYLTAEDLVVIAAEATGGQPAVRDYGLLDAAANRPRASAFGQDAYPTIHLKAAALLHSVVMNHALVDGNKRLAWLATFVFYDVNGLDLDVPDDDGFDLMMSVIKDHLELDEIADRLGGWARPR